jgi:predicted RNase H-like HicB family nuclease
VGGRRQKVRFVVILERGDTTVGAWVPELPGCMAVGKSEEETLGLIREAIDLHLQELRAGREPQSTASTRVAFVEVP